MSQKHYIVKDTEIDISLWNKLASNSEFSSAFQTWEYYKTFNAIPRLKCHAFAVEKNKQSYVAGVLVCFYREKGIKSYFSRRAIVYGGPILLDKNQQQELKLLLNAIIEKTRRKAIYLEIRNFHDYSNYTECYKALNFQYKPYLNIKQRLQFSSLDELIGNFKYNRRREIKLNIKAGLSYREAETENDIKSLYKILNELYTKRVGLPVPDLNFFLSFWQAGIMKIFVVTDDEGIIGGSFCPILPGKSIYTFYYCGKREYKQKLYPTHMAVLAPMEYGIHNKLDYLDFMGAGMAEIDYGVRKYKLAFGGELVEEGRYVKIHNRFLHFIGSKAIKYLKKSKVK